MVDGAISSQALLQLIPSQPINNQLTARRYDPSKGGKIRVESKDKYKARNGNISPDEADSMIMLTMLVRQVSDTLPGLHEQKARSESNEGSIKFEPVKKYVSVEKDDSLSEDFSEQEGIER